MQKKKIFLAGGTPPAKGKPSLHDARHSNISNSNHMSRRAADRMIRRKNNPIEEFTPASPHELKPTEFSLKTGSAKSVQLAADFTDWEKSALEMTSDGNGVWRVVVPLAAGNYSYRFIVDGEWCDDPHCAYHIPNSFGTMNATRKVT